MPPPPAQLFASRVLLGPALRAQPDRRLVDLVRDGYDSAFEEIVRRYRRPLDRFATSIVGGRAEDVTQDAFSKALQSLRKSESEIELRPWLYRIVRNTALNDLRDRGPSGEQLLESLPGSAGADAAAERREELALLMRRLGELPEAQRAALVMRELEGLSHDEIAAALGVSGGAARQAIHRARSALRDGLGLLVPLPVIRAIADRGGEGAEAAAAGGAGVAGAGLAGGAMKVGLATVLVAGSVAGGVAIQHHESVGPEPAGAASSREPATRGLTATLERPGPGGVAHHGGAVRRSGRSDAGPRRQDGGTGAGPHTGLGAESQTAPSGSGPGRHAEAEPSGGSGEHSGGNSDSSPPVDGGSHHSGLDGNSFSDHSGSGGGGGDGLDGGGQGGSGDSSGGSGSGEDSGSTIESEQTSDSGSSGSDTSGSDSSGSGSTESGSSGSGSSGSDGGATEAAADGGSSGSGSGDSGTSGSSELLSTDS